MAELREAFTMEELKASFVLHAYSYEILHLFWRSFVDALVCLSICYCKPFAGPPALSETLDLATRALNFGPLTVVLECRWVYVCKISCAVIHLLMLVFS